jgi:hypothetical protein
MVRNEQGGHPRFVHANADAVARYARLRHFKCRIANAEAIANADLVIGKPVNGEVFSELAEDEAGPLQLLLPVAVRFDLVDEDSPLLTPMPGQVALTVTIQMQPAGPTTARDRVLPDPGMHSAALPLDVTRKSNVH